MTQPSLFPTAPVAGAASSSGRGNIATTASNDCVVVFTNPRSRWGQCGRGFFDAAALRDEALVCRELHGGRVAGSCPATPSDLPTLRASAGAGPASVICEPVVVAAYQSRLSVVGNVSGRAVVMTTSVRYSEATQARHGFAPSPLFPTKPVAPKGGVALRVRGAAGDFESSASPVRVFTNGGGARRGFLKGNDMTDALTTSPQSTRIVCWLAIGTAFVGGGYLFAWCVVTMAAWWGK